MANAIVGYFFSDQFISSVLLPYCSFSSDSLRLIFGEHNAAEKVPPYRTISSLLLHFCHYWPPREKLQQFSWVCVSMHVMKE